MRVVPKKPVEIIRTLARDHLVQVWPSPEQIACIRDRTRVPATRVTCFLDPTLQKQVDLNDLRTRVVLESDAETPPFKIVATLLPDSAEEMMLLLTGDGDVLMATQGDVSIQPDGVIQISGAVPGITLLTPEQLRAQQGRKLYRGATVRGFSVEERGDDQIWRGKPFELRLAPGVIGGIEVV